MNTPTVIGTPDPLIAYVDRPTVKALIFNDKYEVLIINNGLLPGGGLEDSEDDATALHREIQEEVGMTVEDIKKFETVIQYRNYLSRKYIINAYTARYVNDTLEKSPQDEREAQFTYTWYSIEDAKKLLTASIDGMQSAEQVMDAKFEGKLYNLMTTKILLMFLPNILDA